jgi:diguanylate cyclase (GGDEF)-like protein
MNLGSAKFGRNPVLIVDDEPLNLKMLRAQLEAEGRNVVAVSNGLEALEALHRDQFDGVISDIQMPEMDGFRLCMAVRNNERLRDTPFIFYTASFTRQTDRELGESLGADAYLTKPAPIGSLLDALSDARRGEASRIGRDVDCDIASLYGAALTRKIHEKKQLAFRNAMLYSISRMLLGARALDQVMPEVIGVMCDALGWDCGAYWRWDEPSQTFARAEACANFASVVPGCANALASQSVSPAAMGLNVDTWNRAATWIAKSMEGFATAPRAECEAVRSILLVPVNADSRPVGLLQFYSRYMDQADADALQYAETIAMHIGQFVARVSAQNEAYRLAHYDSLTSLPNRGMLCELAARAIAEAQQSQRPLAFLFVDLDGFKQVNDRHGHDAGDRVLATFAQRLRDSLRGCDAVAWNVDSAAAARLGGDEFAVLVSEFQDREALEAVAKRILAAASARFDQVGADVALSASIGIALYPEHGDSIDVLKRVADNAMYRAKQSGKNTYCFAPEQSDAGLDSLA